MTFKGKWESCRNGKTVEMGKWRTQSIMSKDVAMWQLKKDNHIVTFKWEGNGIEVGQGFVGENHLFASWPVNQARNLWATKIEEGYRRYP